MTIRIVPADVPRDLDRLWSMHSENRTSASSRTRFEWLFHQNPDGLGRAWFALDEGTGQVVGSASAFPRRVRLCSGSTVLAFNCGDLSVSQAYRRRGIATLLRSATRASVDAGEAAFLYAHPNAGAIRAHFKAGHLAVGRMRCYAKVLGLHSSWLKWASGAVARVGLSAPGAAVTVTERWPTGTLLESLASARHLVARTRIHRTESYLEWRFRRNPILCHTCLVVEEGRHVGYLVYCLREGVVYVKDWMASSWLATLLLFSQAIRFGRKSGALRMMATVLEQHPDAPLLGAMGFIRRPRLDNTAVGYAPPDSAASDAIADAGRWYMTVGDRDV